MREGLHSRPPLVHARPEPIWLLFEARRRRSRFVMMTVILVIRHRLTTGRTDADGLLLYESSFPQPDRVPSVVRVRLRRGSAKRTGQFQESPLL